MTGLVNVVCVFMEDVDASWGIPSNRYIVCTWNQEISNNNDTGILFNLTEAVPGVHYKLTVTFAPETRYTPEQDGEGNYIGDNASHFQPVRMRISYGVPSQTASTNNTPWGFLNRGTTIKVDNSNYYTTSATALDVVEIGGIDFSCSLLSIESNVMTSQFRKGLQTNELHIAEVRLTPITIAEIDGIYYTFSEMEATVTSGSKQYSGDIVIPKEVIYDEKTYGVTSIDESAFSGCSDMTSITIPESVTSIGSEAFRNCTSLTSVTSLIKEPFDIDLRVFYNVSATLYVPQGTKDLYESAAGWNELTILELDPEW